MRDRRASQTQRADYCRRWRWPFERYVRPTVLEISTSDRFPIRLDGAAPHQRERDWSLPTPGTDRQRSRCRGLRVPRGALHAMPLQIRLRPCPGWRVGRVRTRRTREGGCQQPLHGGPVLPGQVWHKAGVDAEQHLRVGMPELARNPFRALPRRKPQRRSGVAHLVRAPDRQAQVPQKWAPDADLLFALPEAESGWFSLLLSEWLESALPIAASCMIASLPAWLATANPPVTPETLPASQPTVVEPTPVGTVSGRDAMRDFQD
jgi:hypothetical protein